MTRRKHLVDPRALKSILRRLGIRPEQVDLDALSNLKLVKIDMNKYQPDKGLEFLEEVSRIVEEIESKGCKVVYMSADKNGVLHIFYQC